MHDKHIFNSNSLGSEEEKNSLQYNGWIILANLRADNQAQLVEKIRHTFSGDGYEFNEENSRYFIQCNSYDSPIEVILKKIEYKDTLYKKTETYNTIFQSDIFGFRWYEENSHQELCRKVLSKIRKKRGFWVKGSKRFPIPRIKKLRTKKRH
jgi:hypothetical protein